MKLATALIMCAAVALSTAAPEHESQRIVRRVAKAAEPQVSSVADLAAAPSSELLMAEEQAGDFLRASSGAGKTRLQQRASKTSANQEAAKTRWYQPAQQVQQQQQQYQQQQYQQQQYLEQQQVESAPAGQAEPFAFDFNTRDDSGNGQYRKESGDSDGAVRGSYGYTDAAGVYRHVDYVADRDGFRANIKSNEPGVVGGDKAQPADIRLAAPPAPAQPQAAAATSGRLTGDQPSPSDWAAGDSNSAPADFESSHRRERVRAARHFRN